MNLLMKANEQLVQELQKVFLLRTVFVQMNVSDSFCRGHLRRSRLQTHGAHDNTSGGTSIHDSIGEGTNLLLALPGGRVSAALDDQKSFVPCANAFCVDLPLGARARACDALLAFYALKSKLVGDFSKQSSPA